MKNKLMIFIAGIMLVAIIAIIGCSSAEFTGAKVHEKQGNFAEAVRNYEIELKKNPTNAEAWFRVGKIKAEQLNDFDGMRVAFAECKKLTNKYDKDIKNIRFDIWAKHINEAVKYSGKNNPDSVENYPKALEKYRIASLIWPDTSTAYLGIASISQKTGQIDTAIAYLEKGYALSKNVTAYKIAGQLYIKQGDNLIKEFNKANEKTIKTQNSIKEINKGNSKNEVQKLVGAPDNIEKDKKNTKREIWNYKQYGTTFIFDGDKLSDKKTEKNFKPQLDSTKFYEAYAKYDKAILIFEELKTIDAYDTDIYRALLNAYYSANRIEEAAKTFKQAVETDPFNKFNRQILGMLYHILGQHENAINEYLEAIKLDPNFRDGMLEIGATYLELGLKLRTEAQEKGSNDKSYNKNFEESAKWLEKSLTLKEDDSKVWDNLSKAYLLLNKMDKVEKAISRATELKKAGK